MAASVGMPGGFSFGFYYFEKRDKANKKRELSYQGERHILLFGVNGAGKSTRLILKNLAKISGKSIVVLDIKEGELCSQSRRIRR